MRLFNVPSDSTSPPQTVDCRRQRELVRMLMSTSHPCCSLASELYVRPEDRLLSWAFSLATAVSVDSNAIAARRRGHDMGPRHVPRRGRHRRAVIHYEGSLETSQKETPGRTAPWPATTADRRLQPIRARRERANEMARSRAGTATRSGS
jgi:hypothetical protein